MPYYQLISYYHKLDQRTLLQHYYTLLQHEFITTYYSLITSSRQNAHGHVAFRTVWKI